VYLDAIKRPFSKARLRFFDRKVASFDAAPYIAEQRVAFEKCGLDFELASGAVRAFFESRDGTRADTSQHWEVAAGVVLGGQVQRILEIGTERGEFTAFLSSLNDQLRITTIDLPRDDRRYINATTESKSEVVSSDSAVEATINMRRRNINHLERVEFREMSSVRLSLITDEFDLIYVDGDHTYPIVAIDAVNALRLVSKRGWILFDDLISEQRVASEYGGAESTQILKVLEENGIVSVTRFHKRLEASKLINEVDRKFIALARRNESVS